MTRRKLPQTPRAKKVVEYSMEEAKHVNHAYVGTEHLLLGLLREQEGVAAQVLMNAGLRLPEVRDQVTRLLTSGIRSASMPPIPGPSPWGAPLDDLPGDVKAVADELDAEIERLRELKDEAVAAQDFSRAAALRDEADKLASQRRTAIRNWPARHPVDAS
ncbi:MAG TPA: Clp protease N-terminal domain-containing protein [Pirellulales bacterium]|nr:Clp protease N-terminal domain-containing protein [Pirellulales bacterium]